jgi:hypothetical protein
MTTLIYGPPCGGKTELVQALRTRGDLVLDFDQIHSALSGLDLHDHHEAITPFVLDAIQAITRRLQIKNYDRAWLIAGAPSRAARSEFSSFTNENRLVYADRATCHDRATSSGRPDAWHTYIDSWHDAYEPDLSDRSTDMAIERRTADEGVELREEGDTLTAIGYAATFNRMSQNLGGFVERVAPGAFTKTVQEANLPMDVFWPLANRKAIEGAAASDWAVAASAYGAMAERLEDCRGVTRCNNQGTHIRVRRHSGSLSGGPRHGVRCGGGSGYAIFCWRQGYPTPRGRCYMNGCTPGRAPDKGSSVGAGGGDRGFWIGDAERGC